MVTIPKFTVLTITPLVVLLCCNQFAQCSAPIYIHDVRIIGNETTNAEVILREISPVRNLWVDSLDLVTIENRLTNLNLFHRVEVFPYAREDSTYLIIAVTEKWYIFPLPYFHWIGPNPNDFEYGFRYSQMNFQGWNRTIVATYYGGKRTGQLFLFQDPWIAHTAGIGFLTLVQNERWFEKPPLETKEETRLKQSVLLGLTKRFGKEVTLKFGLSFHKWILDTSKTVSKKSNDYTHSLRLEYENDGRDLIELPHKGDYFSLSFEFIRFYAIWRNRYVSTFDYRQYLPLDRRWTLSGQLLSVTSKGEDPSYLQLRLGQTHPLRGHRNLDRPGVLLLKSAVDLRYQLINQRYYTFTNVPNYLTKHFRNLKFGTSVSLFYEVGQSWNKFTSVESEKISSGYGVSFSFTLPYVNVLRFDIGFNPIDGYQKPVFFTELKSAL